MQTTASEPVFLRLSGALAGMIAVLLVAASSAQPIPMSVEESSASPHASARLAELAQRHGGVEAEPPAEQVKVSPIEATPLGQAPRRRNFNNGDAATSDGGESAERPDATWSGGSMLTTLAALGLVIALIFGVRFLLARATKVPMVAASSAVEVLSRTSVAPRSHVLLLRVGPQVLVVGESSGGLRTLGAVQQEDEVASLLQAVESSKPQSIAGGFSSLMGKFNRQYETDAPDAEAALTTDPLNAPPIDRFEAGLDRSEAPVDRARHGLSALAGRLRVRGGDAT
jgi:flagellar biogenesis protein FliO